MKIGVALLNITESCIQTKEIFQLVRLCVNFVFLIFTKLPFVNLAVDVWSERRRASANSSFSLLSQCSPSDKHTRYCFWPGAFKV